MLEEDIFLGDKIRQYRIIKHHSQEELGKVINLNKQAVSRIENGIRRVSHSELVKIAEFLEEPVESFTQEDKFKLIQLKGASCAIPKIAVDFLKDYKLFVDLKELTPESVRAVYKEISDRMLLIYQRRFSVKEMFFGDKKDT
jgi:transcriptional regulator with XRE-family HTH domain